MRRLHPAVKVPLAALAVTVLMFPLMSIDMGPNDTEATISVDAVYPGLIALVVGYAWLGLRWLVTRRWLRPAVAALKEADQAIRAAVTGRRWALGFLLVLLAAAIVFPFEMPRRHVNLAVETLIYATLALGLNVVVGYAGLLVLGYAGFFALGAYTFGILALRFDVSIWLAMPVAGAVAMFAGLLIGLPSLRLRGDYLAIVTLGFGEVVYYFLKTEVALTGGEMGLPNKDIKGTIQDHTGIPFVIDRLTEPIHWYWPSLALLLIAVVVIRQVERSRVGRAMVAMREDETAARCMGINTTRLKLAAFSFSAMWAGFAGVLWCGKTNYTNPKYFEFLTSIIILAIVVLGGMGSIVGSIVGAVLLYAGPILLRDVFPEIQTYRLLIFGAIMVALMIYRPQGLFGSARFRIRQEEDSG